MTSPLIDPSPLTAKADELLAQLADLNLPPRPEETHRLRPATRNGKKTPTPAPDPSSPLACFDPEKTHELLGVHPPYKPPTVPAHRPGCVTFWDPGLSVESLRLKFPALFSNADWAVKLPFAKTAAGEGWRQLRLIDPGKGYVGQVSGMVKDEETALARVVAVYLLLAFRATGGWPVVPRLRCRETLPSGRRVVVGCFPGHGVELASVLDDWKTPGLAVVAVPPVARAPGRKRR